LKPAEPIKGELSGLFRERSYVFHTWRVRQIADKLLRQIICKVTAQRMAGHADAKTTGLCDRRSDDVGVTEVEGVGI
jgi:integrase/recombinase XerD